MSSDSEKAAGGDQPHLPHLFGEEQMTMRLLYEQMICAQTKDHRCRIWRESTREVSISNDDLKIRATDLLNDKKFLMGEAGFFAVCNLLITHAGVNTVEVVELSTGDGICVHKNWP